MIRLYLLFLLVPIVVFGAEGDIPIEQAGGTITTQTLSGDAAVTAAGVISLATSAVGDDEVDYTSVTLSDFTNDAGYFNALADFTGTLIDTYLCTYDLNGSQLVCNTDPSTIATDLNNSDKYTTPQTYGAVADGATDDSTEINAAITALSTAGSVVSPGVLYFPAGDYAISSSIVLKPNVNLVLSEGARILATANMTAMLTQDSNRLRHQFIRGGIWDADDIADSIIALDDFQAIAIEKIGLYNAEEYSIEIDCTGASSNCYELMVRDFNIYRHWTQPAITGGSVGIFVSSANLSDSHFIDGVIQGANTGFDGYVWNSKISAVHVWTWYTVGDLDYCFYMRGGDNNLDQLQCDNPETAGYVFAADDNLLQNSQITLAPSAGVTDSVVDAVQVTGNFRTYIYDNNWNATTADPSFAKDLDGTLTSTYSRGNFGVNVDSRVEVELVDLAAACVTVTAWDSFSTDESYGISSISQNGGGDMTFTLSKAAPDANYYVSVMPQDSGDADFLVPKIKSKTASDFRVQWRDVVAEAWESPDKYCLRVSDVRTF